MKVLLINGSPHPHGCTYTALSEVAAALAAEGVATEMVQLGTGPVQGCTACHKCFELGRCVFNDTANRCAEILKEADGLIIGSPVYYAGPNGALCALLERMFFSQGAHFAGKPGAAVVSCRRAGSTAALDRLNKFFGINGMPVVPSQYWNMVHGHTPEDVAKDEEGLQIMRTLGRNMAWMLKEQAAAGLAPPARETPRKVTNFIR